MATLVTFCLATLAVLAQSTALAQFTLLSVRPDLVVLVVVGWSFLRGPKEAALGTLWAGLLVDLVSIHPFGLGMMALAPVAFLVSLVSASAVERQLVYALGATFLATFLYDGIFLLTLDSQGWPVDWTSSLMRFILPQAVLNTLIMPVVYWFLTRVHNQLPAPAPVAI